MARKIIPPNSFQLGASFRKDLTNDLRAGINFSLAIWSNSNMLSFHCLRNMCRELVMAALYAEWVTMASSEVTLRLMALMQVHYAPTTSPSVIRWRECHPPFVLCKNGEDVGGLHRPFRRTI